MSIKARFSGTCTACGGHFSAGTEIEWQKGKGSRHTKCPSTVVHSKVPLNSPGRAALQGRGRGDFFLGEKTEIARSFTMDEKPALGDLGNTIQPKKGKEAGQYLTSVGLAAHYVSQDEADDFDLVHNGSFSRHWSVIKYYRPATEEETRAYQAAASAQQRKERFEKLCDFTRNIYPQAERFDTDQVYKLADRVRVWKKMVGYSLHEAYRCTLGLVTYHPVYDDSPYSLLVRWVVRWEGLSAEDAEALRNAPEVK